MPDVKYGAHLKVKENAIQAIAQIRDQLADAVIAIVDHPPDACCQVGYYAVPVAKSELPAEKFNQVGMIDDLEVTVEVGLLPSAETKITIGFDTESGTLVAYVN